MSSKSSKPPKDSKAASSKRSGSKQSAKTSKAARPRSKTAQARAQSDGERMAAALESDSALDLLSAQQAATSARVSAAQIAQVLEGLDLSAAQRSEIEQRLTDRPKQRGKPFAAGYDERRNYEGRPKHRTLSEAMRSKLAELVPGAANIDQNTYAEALAQMIILEALQKRNLTAAELTRKLTEPDRMIINWRDKARLLGYDPDQIAAAVSASVSTALNHSSGNSGRALTEIDSDEDEDDSDNSA